MPNGGVKDENSRYFQDDIEPTSDLNRSVHVWVGTGLSFSSLASSVQMAFESGASATLYQYAVRVQSRDPWSL